ncbi:MAG TPA: 3-phosphoshikimate 1-carboxyvinyltransferase [Jatrophihabitantaceae bacterium]|jgi:3-phosphoshikimate 1-carboxyvinyltransferase|nr:3-phosphoshikimate 1-carboxyvinyltransferase [Jatrophihabitantaceae bacterium]
MASTVPAVRQTADVQPWPAPHADGPVSGVVTLPGSKSLTNRALVLSALADGTSRIRAPLWARDTELMARALTDLGTHIERVGEDCEIHPATLHGADVDTGLAGTVMRFVPPLAALATGSVRFDGDSYARERPMATLIDGLRQAGVVVDDDDRGRLPFTIRASGAVKGGQVRIDAAASSQFVSGLLLSAARYGNGIEVVHVGDERVPSAPHIEMSLDMVRRAGVDAAATGPSSWVVLPGRIRAQDWTIEPDLSNAAPFLAAAVVTGGTVTVPGWPLSTTQAGDALRNLLTQLGASVSANADGLVVSGGAEITGIDVDLHDVGELTPVIAAVAALASTPSTLRGIGHLRGHETDRLAALATELTRLGGEVSEQSDRLTIRPRRLHGATWRAYADHRMATAGAVIGLAVDGVVVDDIASTTKTMPDFPALWSSLIGA